MSVPLEGGHCEPLDVAPREPNMTHLSLNVTDSIGKVIMSRFTENNDRVEKWAADRACDLDNPRDDLFEAAKLGLISGTIAEELATKLGCAPLADTPDPSNFDPMIKPFWTLPMAVQWIETRDLSDVTQQMEEYCCDCWVWRVNENLGLPKDGNPDGYIVPLSWNVERRGQPGAESFLFGTQKHKDDLWRKLSENHLEATGRRNGAPREIIPPMRWQDLNPDGVKGQPLFLREGAFNSFQAQTLWTEVTIKRDDILTLWPAMDAGIPQLKVDPDSEALSAKSTNGIMAISPISTKAYKERVKNWPKDNHPPSRKTMKHLCEANINLDATRRENFVINTRLKVGRQKARKLNWRSKLAAK